MRYTPFTAAALPFVLLLALLASIVIAPRLQSTTLKHVSAAGTVPAVQTLPTVVVTASPRPAGGEATRPWPVSTLALQSGKTCALLLSDLRMPYFSFAQPMATGNGL